MKAGSEQNMKVLYILGEGRSGSTLIDNILNEMDGVVSLGEVQFWWQRGYQENQLCGCGERFRECEFWRTVVGSVGEEDDVEDIGKKLEAARYHSLAAFPGAAVRDLVGAFRKSGSSCHKAIVGSIDKLYQSAAAYTNAKVVVDSSKTVHMAYFLARYSECDIRFLHLVRDARGVAFSRGKRKVRSEVSDKKVYMPRMGPAKSAIKWVVNNLLSEQVVGGRPYKRVRYEDFVKDPKGVLGDIIRFVEHDGGNAEDLIDDDHNVTFRGNHTVSGNPGRLSHGEKKIRADERWRSEMSLGARIKVGLISWPVLLRYGYGKW